MAQHRQFPLSAIMLAVAVCALLFARGLSFWFLLLLTQFIAISLCVEILTRHIPAKLIDAARDNCCRMDGTRSHRRSAREQRAIGKVRSDLWAAFLMVALFCTGGIFMVNTVFPVSQAGNVVSAMVDNPGNFRSALKDRGVDDKFFKWSRSSSRLSNAEIRKRQNMLWTTWPVVLILMLVGCMGCGALIRYTYLRALREFHAGVDRRTHEYLNLDTGRLQG